MSLQTQQFYDFGNFRLDLVEKVLLRDGKPISITPKVFETLRLLIENAGHLVEKDELMRKIWQDRFVEESNLSFNIKMLRKALGDDAQNPRFVETVPKRGFRFIAEVRRNDSEDAQLKSKDGAPAPQLNGKKAPPEKFSPPINRSETQSSSAVIALADWRQRAGGNEGEEQISPPTAPGESTEKNTSPESAITKPTGESKLVHQYRLPIVAFALIAFLIGAGTLSYYFYGSKPVTTGVEGKKSIAVLPLNPINTDNRDEIYEIGIADSLIHRLSSIKGFVVRPLSATRQYTDIAQDPLEAGREQRTDYVLASNYQLADGKIRITAQLFNVESGQIEDTYKSEKDAGDVFAMQDAIASEVGNLLLVRFATTSNHSTIKRGTTNEEAYRLYLQGMYLSNNRTAADARKAVEVLEKAVRLDPNYAQAWAGKAYAHRAAGNYGRSNNTHEEYQKSIEAINKALALDENLSDAYSALCENKMYYEYDFDGAERACKRAIELEPDSPLAHQVYSRHLAGRGRFDEAIAEMKTVIDLEPASLFHQQNYANCLYYARRYDEAVAQYKRVLAMDENHINSFKWLINILAFQGKETEAFEWFMKSLTLQKADEETVRIYKTAFQTSGWQGVLSEQANRFDESDEVYFRGAAYNAQIGNKDQAFEYLEKSFQRRELWMSYLQVDPLVDSLRGDPRFGELIKRVGLK